MLSLLFYTSILRYSIDVGLLYTAGFRLWHPVRFYGAPLSEVGGGGKYSDCVSDFCPTYFVCKFLHFSASNLNSLHVVESPPDLFHSIGPEVIENIPDSIRNIATNSQQTAQRGKLLSSLL